MVFDKDNTLTAPYARDVHPDAAPALEEARREFGGDVVLLSNSAGLAQYDPDGAVAEALEADLGVRVLRHASKKPAGTPAALERHFGCDATRLVMVGDRYLTDVVYGNRLGMFTVRVAPFTEAGEPVVVRAVRALEDSLVSRWARKGVRAPDHELIPEPADAVKSPGCW